MNFEKFLDDVKNGSRQIVEPIVKLMVKYNLSPNTLTTISLLICIIAGFFYGIGSLKWGGFLLLFGSFFDMIDGAVARSANKVTKFGALYDSTLDRYSEILVFLGIGIYFVSRANDGSSIALVASLATFIAITGSVMVSYVRARAEGLGFSCKVGLLQRPERVVLVGVTSLIHQSALIGAIFLIAILANYTAIQRLYHIYTEENQKWNVFPPESVDHD